MRYEISRVDICQCNDEGQLCEIYIRKKNEARTASANVLKRQVDEMLQQSNTKFPPADTQTVLKFPDVDRGCTTPRNVSAAVMN